MKLSIVVHIDNAEATLESCLRSIMSQSLLDIEIICVNNASHDLSGIILRQLASEDHRIIPIMQKNWGIAAARNAGLKIAKGEYVTFIEAKNEYVDKKAIEHLVNAVAHMDVDVAYFDQLSGGLGNNKNAEVVARFFGCVLPGNRLFDILFSHNVANMNVEMQIFKLSHLKTNKIVFLSGILFSDILFTAQSLLSAKKTMVLQINVLKRATSLQFDNPKINERVFMSLFVIYIRFSAIYTRNHSFESPADCAIASSLHEIKCFIDCTLEKIAIPRRKAMEWGAFEIERTLFLRLYDIDNAMKTNPQTLYKQLCDEYSMTYEKEYDAYSQLLEGALRSRSFRIGRAVTYIPRKVRGLLRIAKRLTSLSAIKMKVKSYYMSTTRYKIREMSGLINVLSKKVLDNQKQMAEQNRRLTEANLKNTSTIQRSEKMINYLMTTLEHVMGENAKHENRLAKQEVQIHDIKVIMNEEGKKHTKEINEESEKLTRKIGEAQLRIDHIDVVLSGQKNDIAVVKSEIIDARSKAMQRSQLIEDRFAEKNKNLADLINYRYSQSLTEAQYPGALVDWYYQRTGKRLNLESPKTFNEKIQWIKLYGVTPMMRDLSDKYIVREWVKGKIGDQYLIPILQVWDEYEEVDLSVLPNQFALKMNHGCGYNLIVKDKSVVDEKDMLNKIYWWLRRDYSFIGGFEMQYHGIKKKIIVEKYMENDNDELYDYKLWCFKGKVKYIQYLMNRKNGKKMAFYDAKWNLQKFVTANPRVDVLVKKPNNLSEMIKIAETLSQDFNFVRVDLYRLNDGKILFGEMTFTPAAGTCRWDPPEYDRIIGKMIDLTPEEVQRDE